MIGRVSVVETVIHQVHNEQPTPYTVRSSRWLHTDDDVYTRRYTAKPEWTKVETAHIQRAGMLLFENSERAELGKTFPSQEDRSSTAARTVELSLDGKAAHIRVPPGETARFVPHDVGCVFFRCGEEVRCTVTVFPE